MLTGNEARDVDGASLFFSVFKCSSISVVLSSVI